ncbi:hypothetical protein, partial [Delftia acidovorans]|uniref:hypothetical protein n=1 Tax=Delftia acidovorans TaxID=80866 RepID=UPI0035A0A1B2
NDGQAHGQQEIQHAYADPVDGLKQIDAHTGSETMDEGGEVPGGSEARRSWCCAYETGAA